MDQLNMIHLDTKSQFDKIYFISGLRRSGNHLLLQLLVCSFGTNSILFINDFPSLMYNDIDFQEQQFTQFIEKGIFRNNLVNISYGHSQFNCGENINAMGNLIPLDDVERLGEISKSWTDRKKILIMSFEDQSIETMDRVASTFVDRCNTMYKVIIMRDILNCFSSRFQAICNRANTYETIDPVFAKIVSKGGFFKTDLSTLDMWKNHYSRYDNQEYIVFNYNLFMCGDPLYKTELFGKLGIEGKPEFYENKSTFGHGSSFQPSNDVTKSSNEIVNNDDLFLRFYSGGICKQKVKTGGKYIKKFYIDFIFLLRYILNDVYLMDVIRKDFLIDITSSFNQYNIKICGKTEKKIPMPELNQQIRYEKKAKIGGKTKKKNLYGRRRQSRSNLTLTLSDRLKRLSSTKRKRSKKKNSN